jgi:hypothetical protein
MPKRRVTTSEQGSVFEAEVALLLRMMRYTVTRDHLLTGTQTDLLATKADRLSNVALIVECTDRKGGVGVPRRGLVPRHGEAVSDIRVAVEDGRLRVSTQIAGI